MILYTRKKTALLGRLQRGTLTLGVRRERLGAHTRYLISLPGVTVNLLVFRRSA